MSNTTRKPAKPTWTMLGAADHSDPHHNPIRLAHRWIAQQMEQWRPQWRHFYVFRGEEMLLCSELRSNPKVRHYVREAEIQLWRLEWMPAAICNQLYLRYPMADLA